MSYEQDMIEAQKTFDEHYSTGEYCHEQSFLWGFQEGADYKERELKTVQRKEALLMAALVSRGERDKLLDRAKECAKQAWAMRDSFASDDEEFVEYFMELLKDKETKI